MKIIAVASENPVKVQAALEGFWQLFPTESFRVETVAVDSGVGSQPRTDRETLLGALQRARNAVDKTQDADYWVGIEGGIEDTVEGMAAFAWVVVMADGCVGRGRTGTFFLPEPVARLIRAGKELGEADDLVFGRENSKQKEGAIGILTQNTIDRTKLYQQAVVLALLPFKNRDLYSDPPDSPGGR